LEVSKTLLWHRIIGRYPERFFVLHGVNILGEEPVHHGAGRATVKGMLAPERIITIFDIGRLT
jgi:hypothetical protein